MGVATFNLSNGATGSIVNMIRDTEESVPVPWILAGIVCIDKKYNIYVSSDVGSNVFLHDWY